MTRILESARFLGMDVTPRTEYRAHIAYLTKELELMRSDLKATKENLDRHFSMYNQERGERRALENDLIKTKNCKAKLSEQNIALNAEVTNLRSGMEKLKQDLNKAEDRAQEYKDKFTLKSQELTELEAIRERESKQYEERIAKLERELRMQEQAYIEIATVHDEEKNKLEALMEATGCAPYPTTEGKPKFHVPSAVQYPVVDIDKPIPSPIEDVVAGDVASVADEVTSTDLPGMAEVSEMYAAVQGLNKMHQECMEKAEKLFYGDDDGAYDLGDDEPTQIQNEEAENFSEADEEPLPSSPLYEGKKIKRNKRHKR